MQTFVCSECNESFPVKRVIKIKERNQEEKLVCGNCMPDVADEINHISNNDKIKLANPPVKKIV